MIKDIQRLADSSAIPALCSRPAESSDFLMPVVEDIFSQVSSQGDRALRELTQRFDDVDVQDVSVSREEIVAAGLRIEPALKIAIDMAIENIRAFHKLQQPLPIETNTMAGVTCSQRAFPIDSVGLYIPGGTAPLFSTVLMLAIPAVLAGCEEVVLCTPPTTEGKVPDVILYAASACGVEQIYKVGGAQAIAAMATGSTTVPKVDKIFGPGNQFVTAAKSYAVSFGVAIDMPAGPSELLVFADASGEPRYIAADLLSQAEHGSDSQVILVCTEEAMAQAVNEELASQLVELPRSSLARQALANSRILICSDTTLAWKYINSYGPEHLIIASSRPEAWVGQVRCAGSVFLGNNTPESIGDYASGTNHTLPTNGWARSYSGVNMDAYYRKITFQQVTPAGLQAIGPNTMLLAQAEGLTAHSRAIEIRLQTAKKTKP